MPTESLDGDRSSLTPVSEVGVTVTAARPDDPEVRSILERHLAFCRAVTPPDHVFALDLQALVAADVTFFTAHLDGAIVGMGALKRLNEASAEIKSTHVLSESRTTGVGRAILATLLDVAASWHSRTVFLETGTGAAFEAAKRLYESAGFVPCPPFGDYQPSDHNTFMCFEVSQSPSL